MQKKQRYILHIKTTSNNILFTLTDFLGNKKFQLSAKALKYKSKQVRRTIVSETLWAKVIEKLKIYRCKLISLNYKSSFFKKKHFITELNFHKIKVLDLNIEMSVAFNGCKTRHYRRV